MNDVEDYDAMLGDDDCGPAEDEVTLLMSGKVRLRVQKLRERIDELTPVVKPADPSDTRLTTGDPEAEPESEELIAARQELADMDPLIRKYTRTFRLRAMSPPDFNELYNNHPPRIMADGKRHPHDALGIDASTFYQALLRQSIVEPVMTDERFEATLKKINDKQMDKLATAAWLLNRTDEDIPFSQAA